MKRAPQLRGAFLFIVVKTFCQNVLAVDYGTRM